MHGALDHSHLKEINSHILTPVTDPFKFIISSFFPQINTNVGARESPHTNHPIHFKDTNQQDYVM